MKSTSSESSHSYFCDEPWTGIFSVRTDDEVVFCPCYLQMPIGNINEQSIDEIWNSPKMVLLRASFRRGELPPPCHGQLCPVALGERPPADDPAR